MSAPGKAVFLSYASQDAGAVERIAGALRAAGVEVWFDRNELVGGDAWDRKIRQQIKECALFVPVISAHTDARPEGYFRLEWLLAVERARLMADDHPFLFPIALGELNEAKARVPEKFREVQWTRVRMDETPAELAARVARVLAGGAQPAGAGDAGAPRAKPGRAAKTAGESPRWWRMVFPVAGTLMGLVWATKVFWQPRRDAAEAKPAAVVADAKGAGQTEARQLVARAWGLLNKPELSRLELEAADDLCRRAATLDPTDAEVQAAWSQVDSWMLYQHLDLTAARQASARSKAMRALQLAPESYEARLAQACFLVRGRGDRGRPDNVAETEAALRALLAERPEEPRALLALGILLRNVERPEEARTTFETLARNPVFAALGWNEVGWVRFGAGEMAAADEAADRSIAAQPYWANLMLKSWLAQMWHGDLDAMRKTFERIPESFRRSEQGLNYALTVHYVRRDAAACLRVLDEISSDWMDGWNFGPKAAWAMLAHRAAGGREAARRIAAEAALRTIEQRLTTKPSDWQTLEWKGFVLAELGRMEEAAQVYRQARQSQAEPDVVFELREALALGRLERAIEVLEGMAAKGPSPHVTAAEVRLHPLLDALRGHPRFVALQAKLDADPRFTPTPKRTAATMTEGKSVAVLPFANQSGGSDDSFADGISEELGIVLCKVPGLRVAGWSSALSFKGKNVPEAEIARQLGVTHIVGGTVSRSGTQIVIRARLVNAADGFQVWADRFTPEAKDIFAVQDEIAGQIAEKLQLKLGVDARRTRAVNPEAHRLVLEGRHFWNRRNEEGFARAEAAFLKAIELDPNFAEAHVGLAGVYAIRADYQPVSGRSAAVAADVARARRAAERAVDLGEQLAEANAVLAYAHMIQGEQDAAGRRFASALALNPQSPMIILWQAVWHTANGRIDAALENHARVQSIDPLWFINLHLQAEALFYAGRLVEALALNERATGLRSDVFVPSLGLRAQTLFALGRREEALEAARSVRKILSSDTRWHADAAAIRVIKLCGEEAEARAYAEEWLRDEARERVVRPIVLAALGRGEDAMAELVDLRMSQRRGLFWDPIWDPWRADPRFEAVLVRLGCLAEYRTARTTQARLQAERKEPSR